MKRIILTLAAIFSLSTGIFAEENDSAPAEQTPKSYTPPATSFLPMLTLLGVYMPNNGIIDVNIPYVMPMLQARFSHRFTDFNAKPEFSFIADGELAPVWVRAGGHFDFKPFSPVTLSLGTDISTSWGLNLNFLEFDFIGKYSRSRAEYESFSPFSHWVYDFWAQAAFKYDIGSAFSGEKHHIVFDAAYRAQYTAMTGVSNGEVWMHQGESERANGFTYKATAALSYQIPHKYLKTVGASACAEGYFSDKFFDEEYRISDPTFVDLTFALTATASIGWKNHFMLMVPFSGKRNFDCDDALRPLTAPEGRKWSVDGVILTFTHIF
ncbi:hypothetical protein [Treponema sp.]|uniref:hypothetical protein n=1 Tax=Treponema sp. TaxID=166 RepID=UPI00388F2C20